MTVVWELFTNSAEGTSGHTMFVRGKKVKYDATTINQLLRLPYNPSGPDEVEYLMNTTNMGEVSRAICKSGGTRWTIVRDEHAHFPSTNL